MDLTKSVRKPVAQGRFYPAGQEALRETVRHYLQAADVPNLKHVRAVIAPHAGYACSGPVAGHSFQVLGSQPKTPATLFLLGPAHWAPVDGIAFTPASHYATPLGEVEVDAALCNELISNGAPFYVDDAAHRPEHALEVELPFLQAVLPRFRIVPVLLQDVRWSAQLSAALSPIALRDPSICFVVSSDLSHYHPYRQARKIDVAFLQAVAAEDFHAASRGEACGLPGILALMTLAASCGWRAHVLAYANSGDTCGDRRSVVGYGSIAYTA